jgi:hypothetical protein
VRGIVKEKREAASDALRAIINAQESFKKMAPVSEQIETFVEETYDPAVVTIPDIRKQIDGVESYLVIGAKTYNKSLKVFNTISPLLPASDKKIVRQTLSAQKKLLDALAKGVLSVKNLLELWEPHLPTIRKNLLLLAVDIDKIQTNGVILLNRIIVPVKVAQKIV